MNGLIKVRQLFDIFVTKDESQACSTVTNLSTESSSQSSTFRNRIALIEHAAKLQLQIEWEQAERDRLCAEKNAFLQAQVHWEMVEGTIEKNLVRN